MPARWMQFTTVNDDPVIINMDQAKIIRPRASRNETDIGGVYIDDIAVKCDAEMFALFLNVDSIS